jgi:ankyrin repeat protein
VVSFGTLGLSVFEIQKRFESRNRSDMTTKADRLIERLIEASEAGDSETVRLTLDSGVDLHSKDQYGYTALFYAALRGHATTVRLLLDAGAAVNVTANNGSSPLMAAVLSGRLEVVRLLIDAGADVNAENEHGYTPIMAAATHRFDDIVRFLENSMKSSSEKKHIHFGKS